MGQARRFTSVAAWVLLVWAALLGLWAMQPLSDQVPTGKVDGTATSVSVECARPIDADPGPDGALPELESPQKYQRDPCIEQHSDNRWMLLVNVVLIAGIAVGLVVVRSRLRHPSPSDVSGRRSTTTM